MLLVCEVEANPAEVDFLWMLENNTYTENVKNKGLTSTITLIASPEKYGKYKCFANNSIGMSTPCERAITGMRIHDFSIFPRFRVILKNSLEKKPFACVLSCDVLVSSGDGDDILFMPFTTLHIL